MDPPSAGAAAGPRLLLVLGVGRGHEYLVAPNDRRRPADARNLHLPLHVLVGTPFQGQRFLAADAGAARPAKLRPVVAPNVGTQADGPQAERQTDASSHVQVLSEFRAVIASSPFLLVTPEGRFQPRRGEDFCVHARSLQSLDWESTVHYLLFYEVASDYVERRAPFRAEHLALARAAQQRGELVLGGALAGPVDGAVLLFRGESPAVAEAFAAADPYVRNGVVTRWHVRKWTTVVGDGAALPAMPSPFLLRPAGFGKPVCRLGLAFRAGSTGTPDDVRYAM